MTNAPTPVEISRRYDLKNPDDLDKAMLEMKAIHEHELYSTINLANTVFPEYSIGAWLAHGEIQRRSLKQNKWLTWTSVLFSGLVGMIGVLVGAILTHYLDNF